MLYLWGITEAEVTVKRKLGRPSRNPKSKVVSVGVKNQGGCLRRFFERPINRVSGCCFALMFFVFTSAKMELCKMIFIYFINNLLNNFMVKLTKNKITKITLPKLPK